MAVVALLVGLIVGFIVGWLVRDELSRLSDAFSELRDSLGG